VQQERQREKPTGAKGEKAGDAWVKGTKLTKNESEEPENGHPTTRSGCAFGLRVAIDASRDFSRRGCRARRLAKSYFQLAATFE